MAVSSKVLSRGTLWTTGTYFVSVAMRFGSNVILSRLVRPEIFGMMLIISTLRNGIELVSDVGIGQNIIHNEKGQERTFRDTAWTIQFVRGVLLSSLMFILAVPIGRLYALPSEAIQISALGLALMGSASVSIYMLQRQMKLIQLNLFDLAVEVINAVFVLALAFYSPTIWSLLAANLLTIMVRTCASYLLPYGRVWFAWHKEHVREIVHFGKWIFLSSLLSFMCASFDKLYLGQAVPLALVGIYGISRTIADLPAALVSRLSYSVVFPAVSSLKGQEVSVLRNRIGSLRRRLLFALAACMGFGISVADIAVQIIYDARYHDAGWMLPILLLGVWGFLLGTISEFVLLGIGRPLYGAIANLLKLLFMIVAVPLALKSGGLPAAIVALAFSEIIRYAAILVGQRREHLTFLRQDIAATVLLCLLVALFSLARSSLGYGTAFDSISKILAS